MEQPANIDSYLVRFRAGQQHAIVERVEEPLLADPALLLDQDAMHHRYLARRSAEAEQRDPDPDAHRSEEHTSELQSLMRISYAVSCLNNKILVFCRFLPHQWNMRYFIAECDAQ